MPSQPLLKPTPRARSPTLLGITINSTLGTKSRARDYVPLLLKAPISKITRVKPSLPYIASSQFRIAPITCGHTPRMNNDFADFIGPSNHAIGIINPGNLDSSDGFPDRANLFLTIRGIHAVYLQLCHSTAFGNFDTEYWLEAFLDGDRNRFA